MKVAVILLNIVLSIILFSCSSTKNLSSTERDGSSFEKAITVKGVSEEYEYVSKVCPDCRIMSQSLYFERKKPYDVLKFKNGEGKVVEYYFDISEFYGKMFD